MRSILKNEKLVLSILLILLSVLTYWTIFSSSRLPGGEMSDTVSQGYPFFSYTESRISQGELPLWNPYVFCGIPFYASFSSPVFYPLRGLPMLLFGSEVAIRFLFPIHLFLAGLFAWMFLKSVKLSKWGALIGAFAYASGAWANTLFYAGHGSKIICWAWLPLLLWAVIKWANSHDTKYIGFGALAIGMQGLSSHPQMVLYSAGFALILTLFQTKKPLPKSLAKNLVALTSILLLGGALAAVQLYPGYLFSQHTSRGEDLSLATASSYSLAPEETLTMFLPNLFGLRHGFTDSTINGIPIYYGRLGLRLSSEFMGVAFFLLAIIGLIFSKKKKTRLALLAITITGMIVSFGGYTPIFGILYKIIPIFRKLRAPHMAAFVTTSSLALASGLGFDTLFNNELDKAKLKKITTTLISITILFLIFLLAAEPISKSLQSSWWTKNGVTDTTPFTSIISKRASLLTTDFLRAFVVTGLLAFMVFLTTKDKLKAGIFVSAILLISAFELIPFNRSFQVYLPNTTIESLYPDSPTLRETVGSGRVFPGGNEYVPLQIRSVMGYHAAKPALTDKLMALVRTSSPWILRQTGMTVIATNEGIGTWADIHPALAAEIPHIPAEPMPRAFIPRSIVSASSSECFTAIEQGVNPEIRTFVESATAVFDGVVGSAEIIIDEPEFIQIRTETSGAGYLVLADTWFPNWKATVDQVETEVFKANGWMRAVQVPAGEHIVEFTYSSHDVVTGGIISSITILVIVALILLTKFKERKKS